MVYAAAVRYHSLLDQKLGCFEAPGRPRGRGQANGASDVWGGGGKGTCPYLFNPK